MTSKTIHRLTGALISSVMVAQASLAGILPALASQDSIGINPVLSSQTYTNVHLKEEVSSADVEGEPIKGWIEAVTFANAAETFEMVLNHFGTVGTFEYHTVNKTIALLAKHLAKSTQGQDMEMIRKNLLMLGEQIQAKVKLLRTSEFSDAESRRQIRYFTMFLGRVRVYVIHFHPTLQAKLVATAKLEGAGEESAFKDSTKAHWYNKYVLHLKKLHILNGYKDKAGKETGIYGAGDPVTVGEALKIALGIAGEKPDTVVTTAAEARRHWAIGYQQRAKAMEQKLDVVSDAALNLDRSITRAELIRLLFEALGVVMETEGPVGFKDVSNADRNAIFLHMAYQLGIISGDAATGLINGNRPVNRAEMAKIVTLVMQTLVN